MRRNDVEDTGEQGKTLPGLLRKAARGAVTHVTQWACAVHCACVTVE